MAKSEGSETDIESHDIIIMCTAFPVSRLGNLWHFCCSVLFVGAFDVASFSCTVGCGFVAPFEVVTSISIF